MITLLVRENNTVTQSFYDEVINGLQFHQLTCPCGHSGCLSVHGYYRRFVRSSGEKISLRICRVRCECCGHTHALLLSSIVPHSQITLTDHVSIIVNYMNGRSQDCVMDNNPLIDESCYRYIIRCYMGCWHEKLIAERIRIFPVPDLILSCFSYYSRQFMQIKSTPNILFINTT